VSRRVHRVLELRRAIAAAVGEGTLRGTAREVGLSAPALRNFINGAEPRRPATLRKLESWYVRRLECEAAPADVDAVQHALAILLRDLPEEMQPQVAQDTLTFLRGQYAEHGALPAWLAAAQAHLRSPPPSSRGEESP